MNLSPILSSIRCNYPHAATLCANFPKRILPANKQRTTFGGPRWINAVYTPTFDSRGVPDGWVAVVIDIDKRKRLEEELRDADRRKNEFLATLAHELRNPLAPICNSLELLERADGDSATSKHARTVLERQVDQLVRLIDDLLDVSRISRGKLHLRKQRLELVALVQEVLDTLRPLIESRGHKLSVMLPLEPIYLTGDSTRLAQILTNLLDNAAKYMDKGGHIWLTAGRPGQAFVLSVRDAGIGIEPEHLPRIFEMFSQLVPALERSQGGLGLGLALVRGLVELHGGTVEARSSGSGQGSEFVVRLPIHDEARREKAEEGAKSSQTVRPPRRRILLVEDNRDTAATMTKLLEAMGHEVATAFDGQEAIEVTNVFRPNVAFLDIGLPKLNGYQVARQLRTQDWASGLFLIALSGWGQVEDKQRAMESGFDQHLTKPVKAAVLEELLATLPAMKGK